MKSGKGLGFIIVGVLAAFVAWLLSSKQTASASTVTGQVNLSLVPGTSTIPSVFPQDPTTGLPKVSVSNLPGIVPGYALQSPYINPANAQYTCGQSGYYPVVDSDTGALVCVPGSSLGIQ